MSLRIVPFEAGLHGGAISTGAFTILDFARRQEPTTVYVQGLTGALFLDKPAEADRYSWAFDDLLSASLDESATRGLLLGTAKGYES